MNARRKKDMEKIRPYTSKEIANDDENELRVGAICYLE